MALEHLESERAVLLLVDHQDGTVRAVKSIGVDDLKHNAVMLAKTAAILDIPAVLTTSMEEHMQGPLLDTLQQVLPDAAEQRIRRSGIINAMDDPSFVRAVEATGRRQIILAGVTNDVCTVLPALSLLRSDYEVFVAADAGGSPTTLGDDLAIRRLADAGAVVVGTGQIVAELARDWSSPEGSQIIKVVTGLDEAGPIRKAVGKLMGEGE